MSVALRRQLVRTCVVSTLGLLPLGTGTIVEGNATFTIIGTPVFNLPAGDATIVTDTGAVDQLYKYSWYYRTPLNNQNSAMSKVNTPLEQYIGDSMMVTWTNAGPGAPGVERFDAQLNAHVDDRETPGVTVMTHTMTVKNVSETTRTFQFFNLIDMDLSGTPLDDTYEATSIMPTIGVRVALSEPSGKTAECFGQDATRWEVGSGSSLRAKLSGGSQNLSNSVGPFTGDGAVAFQWTVTLAPGESLNLYGGLALGLSVPCQADFDRDGFVSGDDVDAFLLYFTLGSPLADFDRNGFTNGEDFDPFIVRFEAGC